MTANLNAEKPYQQPVAGAIDERDEVRIPTSSQTAALCRDGRRRLVRMVNLSRTGAMIGHAEELAAGDQVTLQMVDHGEVEAEVRWAEGGRAGLHFARPLE